MAKEIILPFSELKGTLNDTPIEPTLEITENGVYNVKGYTYADVNVEGGGGESDFSTAEVTVINNTGEHIDGTFMCVRDTPMSSVIPLNSYPPNDSTNFTVPLYKGNCAWKVILGTHNISVSGDIEWNSGSRMAFITGDGTITFNHETNSNPTV